jgi:hypothetical protein
VLKENRRSMLMQRMMQLLQVKMNGMLLEGAALSRCAKSMSAVIDNEASFESTFDDLQQFDEEEQAGCAEQQGAGDLQKDQWPLTPMLRLPCPLLTVFGLRMVHSCVAVHQSCLGIAKGHLAAQSAIE